MDLAACPVRATERPCRTPCVVPALAVFAAVILPAAAAGQGIPLPGIEVVTTSPLSGAGLDRDKVPARVQTLTADDFQRTYSPSVTDTLMQRIPGVSTTDVQGNGFVQDL